MLAYLGPLPASKTPSRGRRNCFGGRTRRLTGEISESYRARLTFPLQIWAWEQDESLFRSAVPRETEARASLLGTLLLWTSRVSDECLQNHPRPISEDLADACKLMQGISFEVTRSFLRERARARSCRKRQQRQSFEEKRGLRREDVQVEEVLKLLQLQEVMSCVKSTSSRRR